MNVTKPDILSFDTELQEHVQAGNSCRASTGGDDLDILKGFAGHMQGVLGRSTHDDGGAVLVVVKDRDVHTFAADPFHCKTIGCLDVFEVHRAKARFERTHDLGQLFGVGFIHFDVETVYAREFLEKHRLAFHHGLRGQRTDVSKSQNGAAVADHGHQIAA